MPLNPAYFTEQDWQEITLDKDTGAPLSGGFVYFYEDDNRLVPKLVYELVNVGGAAPPNYAYMPLPNPLQLSAVGSPMDANGNDVAVYYYPYDANGDIQLYYIRVTNSLGVPQFTREAWPNAEIQAGPINNNGGPNSGNQILNPQFVDVNFIPTSPLVIPYTGAGTTTVPIAYGWNLTFSYLGAGSITVTRTSVAGNAAYPGNPPYTLTIAPGANLTAVSLTQQLTNNPDIFAPAVGGLNGYLAGSILLAPGSSIIMSYQENSLALQQILNVNNVSANYEEFDATVQLAAAANPATSDTGYVNIVLTLPTVLATTFSNVQIISLQADQNLMYEQQTANKQRSLLFNYYNPLLQFKPLPSYLLGWDFAVNPAQFLGYVCGPFNTGANTSNYVWDNTIVFQSVTNSFNVVQGLSGSIVLGATADTQLAIIQYIESPRCNKILAEQICCMIEAATSQPGGYPVTVSLWVTTNANLPSITGTGQSFVTGLDANGHPNAVVAGWTELGRNNLGNAKFTIQTPNTQNPALSFNYYPFSGWNGAPVATTSIWMAIVIGSGVITTGRNFTFQSVGLQSGLIPTIPAPKSPSETLIDCQYNYQKSFIPGVVPVQNIGFISGESYGIQANGATLNTIGPIVRFPVPMYSSPTVTFYNPVAANAQITNISAAGDWTVSTPTYVTQNGFLAIGTSNAGSGSGNCAAVHWTADARLGI